MISKTDSVKNSPQAANVAALTKKNTVQRRSMKLFMDNKRSLILMLSCYPCFLCFCQEMAANSLFRRLNLKDLFESSCGL